jgi:hypothetical protein
MGTGSITHFSVNQPITQPLRVWVQGFNRIRWEVDTSDGTVVTVIHGRGGWSDSGSGRRPLPASRVAGNRLELFPALVALEWLSDARHSARSRIETSAEGRRTHRLSVEFVDDNIADPTNREAVRRLSRCELVLDETTAAPVGLRYFEHAYDWRIDVPVELHYSDFRPAGSLILPHRITRSVQGTGISEVQFAQIQMGATIPSWLFERR